jgi:hypothetical protein
MNVTDFVENFSGIAIAPRRRRVSASVVRLEAVDSTKPVLGLSALAAS